MVKTIDELNHVIHANLSNARDALDAALNQETHQGAAYAHRQVCKSMAEARDYWMVARGLICALDEPADMTKDNNDLFMHLHKQMES